MPTRRLALTVLLLLATVQAAGCAKHSGGQTGDEDALPSGDELFGELAKRQGFGNYEPASSVGELAERSERVVVGRAVALRAGRSFVIGEGSARSTIHTVVLELEVEQTLKGPERDALFLEFIVGASETGAPAELPEARVIAFAVDAGDGFLPNTHIEDDGRGLPAGERLFRLTNPQGFAASKGDEVEEPFEPGDDLFAGGDLDAVINSIERALGASGGDRDAGVAAGAGGAAGSAAGTGGRAGAAGGAGTAVLDAGSAAGTGGSLASDGGCPGELPFAPGANPAPACPAQCFEVRGLRFDPDAMCIDYESRIVIGCLEGAAPPSTACVERTNDGARYFVPSAWPFRTSTVYRECSADDSATVFSAPQCP